MIDKNFKNLNLNREKLVGTIDKFCAFNFGNYEVNPKIEELGPTLRRVHFQADGTTLYLDFHFRKNGSTTIDPSSGGNNSLKESIAVFIKNDTDCGIGDKESKNKWFVAKDIKYEEYLTIIEILKESEYCKSIETHTKHEENKCEAVALKGIYDEKLTVSYYHTSNKIMLQGRPLLLFNEGVVCIVELVDTDELPKLFNDYFKVEIPKEDVNEQYEHYLPNSHDKHPTKLKKFLMQAVYNYNLEGEMFAYDHLPFPAVKALEGHLKMVLNKYSIEVKKNSFYMFDKTNGRHELQEKYKTEIRCTKTVAYIEEVYNFYFIQRHSLAHWGDVSEPIDQTRILENITEAKSIIMDSLRYIDSYFVL